VRSQAAREKAESHCRRESELLSDLIDTLEPDDVFWDVGANIGVFSCFAAQKLIDGSVIAFEPFPPNVQQLEKKTFRTMRMIQKYWSKYSSLRFYW